MDINIKQHKSEKIANRKRNIKIGIWLSPEESDRLAKLCSAMNMTRNNVLVYLINNGAEQCSSQIEANKFTEAIKELTCQIKKIGTNINQIAHKVNIADKVSETELAFVKGELKKVWLLLGQLRPD